MTHEFFATAPHGAEDLLVAELSAFGLAELTGVKQRSGGVAFFGPLAAAYHVCLWSRIAGRVLLRMASLDASDPDALYASAQAIDWTGHLAPGSSFAISAAGRSDPDSAIDNTHFAALRVKDALVDQLRERWGSRPDVDLDRPDLRLRLHLRGVEATLSVDLAGEGLHRRGYRVASVAAPLRENLAAAILLRAGAADRPAFVDPMCGSATLLIEAAWMAADIAPGLLRTRWGFEGWVGHEPELWAQLVAAAEARREIGLAASAPRLVGYDAEPDVVRAALACIEAAGLVGRIHVERRTLGEVEAPKLPAKLAKDAKPGEGEGPAPLLVSNPPWGERLGNRRELESLYAALGRRLREGFPGWDVALLLGDPGLGRCLGIRARKRNALHDGPIACQILRIEVPQAGEGGEAGASGGIGPRRSEGEQLEPRPRSPGAEAFANRLAKNAKKLRRWLGREGVSCYRLYDADMPEYNFAVDLYTEADGGPVHAHVQEYAPPKTVDEVGARRRRGEALAMIREELGLPRERVHLKRRERQRGRQQYEKLDESGNEFVVAEGPARLWVNLDDYLDTGLFLDHRPIRARVREAAAGKQVLNLFCYTATVSVHAALGGAKSTTSVDLSRTYLEWGARNFALNGLTCATYLEPDEPRRKRVAHELVRADVLAWIREQGARRWDLIFLDPPSFSNSKRMDGTLDIQRDHVELIHRCVALLRPGGELWFSTNLRRFSLEREGLEGLDVREIKDSVPPDFSRNAAIHHGFIIRR